MIEKARNYWQAAKSSFKWLPKVRTKKVTNNAVTTMSVGFQPFSISAYDDMVLMTDYFAPAVCMNKVTVVDGTLKFEVVWIHGALNGITRCRGGFPDMSYPSGANRCCTAFFSPDGESVCIGRIDREFFVLAPQDDSQWKLMRRVQLPGNPGYPYIHSASIEIGDRLVTVESNAACDKWRMAAYRWGSGSDDWASHTPDLTEQGAESTPPYHYGITYWDGPVLVTSSHAVRGENPASRGIYINGKLEVPDVVATGVCKLDEGLLLTQYGQEESPIDTDDETGAGAHKGIAGQFIFVPKALLPEV